MNHLMALENITKSYTRGSQTVHALRGVNLTIDKGEYVSIMGPSGSGKSTLMNIIGCLDIPTDGTYELDGIELSQMSDDQQAQIRNKRIGFVFQQFNLLPRTTALKQVSLPLMYAGLGRKEREERAKNALGQVGLGDRMDHTPDELSGGQQQRVAVARALVVEPNIILADEPTGALDSKTGDELMDMFDDLHEQGITIIMITHDPEVAERSKRQIMLRDGLIVSDSKTAESEGKPNRLMVENGELVPA